MISYVIAHPSRACALVCGGGGAIALGVFSIQWLAFEWVDSFKEANSGNTPLFPERFNFKGLKDIRVGESHQLGNIPSVMAGRYLFMALLLAVFSFLKDFRALFVVFAALAAVSFIDVMIYHGGETAPHIGALVLSAIGAGFSAWAMLSAKGNQPSTKGSQ